jgi:hypothetical protein
MDPRRASTPPTAALPLLAPSPAPAVFLPAFGRGLAGLQHGFVALILGVTLLVALRVPGEMAQARSMRQIEEVVRVLQENAGEYEPGTSRGRGPDLEALAAGEGDFVSSTCMPWLLELLVIAPVFAGLSIVGVRAAEGRGSLGDLLAGFARWLPVVLSSFIILLAGTGLPVAAFLCSIAASVVAFSRHVPSDAAPASVLAVGASCGGVLLLALVLPILWISARLWFAPLRAADIDRPACNGLDAVKWSWRATRRVQWPLFALALVAAVVGSGAAFAAAEIAALTAPRGGEPSIAVQVATSSVAWMLVLPGFVAVVGAAYAIVAESHEAAVPPIDPGAAPGTGGMAG